MTLEKCLAVATEIENKILIPRGAIVERSSTGRNYSHLRWMIAEMRTFGQQDPDKALRWLGFIQGALVWGHVVSLERVVVMNRQPE